MGDKIVSRTLKPLSRHSCLKLEQLGDYPALFLLPPAVGY